MAVPVALSPTSYVVLGLVGALQPVTPYEMKQHVATSIGYFWPFPHSQLYAEPARLAAAGLLEEHTEPGGRRRKTYRLADTGRRALAAWLADPATEPTELRDQGLLKLFFGTQTTDDARRRLAVEQHQAHLRRHREYEDLRAAVAELATPYELATLALGLRYERAAADFWAELAEGRVPG